MTTTSDPAASTTDPVTDPALDPTFTADPPIVLTLATMNALDVCGDYLRTFARLFPETTHPTGVVLTEASCRAHATSFDWSWAVDAFLNWTGREEYDRLRTSRAAEYRRFGTAVERRASIVGHLVATRPELRSSRLLDATVHAQVRADERVVQRLRHQEERIEYAEGEVSRWTQELTRHREALPALREEAAPALARQTARDRDRRLLEVTSLTRQLEQAQARLAEADAALEATTLPPPVEPTPAADLDVRTVEDAP